MKHFLFLLVILLFSSCSSFLSKCYGLKDPKHLSDQEIIKLSKKYSILQNNLLVLDSSYFSFLSSLDGVKYKRQIKNHSQPLQALYYDSKGELISFHVNCFAGGFPNLNWDRNGIFESFVPKTQAPLDSIVSLQQQFKYIGPASTLANTTDQDYYVVVYWNRFMGRQSKRLIKFVNDNLKLTGNKKVVAFFVNTDNAYVDKVLKSQKKN